MAFEKDVLAVVAVVVVVVCTVYTEVERGRLGQNRLPGLPAGTVDI